MSAKLRISSNDTFLTLFASICFKVMKGSYAIQVTSKTFTSFKTFFEISPKPIKPRTFPFSSFVTIDVLGHVPCRVNSLII